MILQFFHYLWHKYRPPEGWLPILLLLGVLLSGLVSVQEVNWVPEDNVVVVAAILGLFFSIWLAKRPLKARFSWLLITLYGLFIVTMQLGRLWPNWLLLYHNPTSLFDFWRTNGAYFYKRISFWFETAVFGGTSQETIAFAFGLGLATWFLSAYAGWTTYRERKPLLGLTVMGVGFSINMFFGNVPPLWSAVFVGQVVLLTAVLQYATLELEWKENKIDFSEELSVDLTIYSAVIAGSLLGLSYAIPGIPYSEIARTFRNQPIVEAIEDGFSDLFGGVREPNNDSLPSAGEGVQASVLPRSYLIGNAPELYEIVMMEATVSLIDENGTLTPAPYDTIRGSHWRGLNYSEYTGIGWAINNEREENISADVPLQWPEFADQQLLWQQIDWQKDQRLTRYSLGIPVVFDEEVTLHWRGLNDLVRVQGASQQYEITSRISVATEDALRETAVSDLPSIIVSRYTQLPDTVPQRIYDLANEIAGEFDNPYDQAQALQQYLRQFPYSLDVPAPPPNRDPVDYFLFELQEGYCDYYASSMVVMARALGLPARLSTGFVVQRPNEDGVQTIYQINGHSWAEIYFPEYGWVEFEPTATFPVPRETNPFALFDVNTDRRLDVPTDLPTPDALPEGEVVRRQLPWGRLGFVAGAGLVFLLLVVWQSRRRLTDVVLLTYGRLQTNAHKLGFKNAQGNTPFEFQTQFATYLNRFSKYRLLAPLIKRFGPALQTIVSTFVVHQYAPEEQTRSSNVSKAWQKIKRPFWLLRFLNFFIRQKD